MSGIYIYSGSGADAPSAQATRDSIVKILGSEEENRVVMVSDPSYFSPARCLKEGNALVIPGGHTPTIAARLTSQMDQIEAFVKQKKCIYLGICAGAYLGAAKGFFFDRPLRLTKTEHLPCQTVCELSELERIGVQAVKVFDIKMQRSLSLIWWFGGAFTGAQGSEEVVALYRPEGEGKIAVLQPRSNVLLSNVHPEFQISERVEAIEELPNAEKSKLSGRADVTEWFTQKLSSIGIKKSEKQTSSAEIKSIPIPRDEAQGLSDKEPLSIGAQKAPFYAEVKNGPYSEREVLVTAVALRALRGP